MESIVNYKNSAAGILELISADAESNEKAINGALDILMKEGNRKKHNDLVKQAIRKAEKTADVIVLAQGSMLVLEPELKGFKKPILTSPRLGVEIKLGCEPTIETLNTYDNVIVAL